MKDCKEATEACRAVTNRSAPNDSSGAKRFVSELESAAKKGSEKEIKQEYIQAAKKRATDLTKEWTAKTKDALARAAKVNGDIIDLNQSALETAIREAREWQNDTQKGDKVLSDLKSVRPQWKKVESFSRGVQANGSSPAQAMEAANNLKQWYQSHGYKMSSQTSSNVEGAKAKAAQAKKDFEKEQARLAQQRAAAAQQQQR